jgi:HTH-type transcriptional regulator / antitoxin HigA
MRTTLIVIENDADHAEAMALVHSLMESTDPAALARLTAQARLVEAYEQSRWPRQLPSVADLLVYLMDQHGLSREDLVPLLGTKSRVSEVLNGKRALSMSMMRRLRDRFDVPADLLIPRSRRRRSAAPPATARQHVV